MQNTVRKGDWLGTYTGGQFWPLDPKPEEICLPDIVQALSNICRFNGHTNRFYSVAEHCLNVEKILDEQGCHTSTRLYGLLHDAAEAYVCDIPRPLKAFIMGYSDIEDRVLRAVYDRFGLEGPDETQMQLIKRADDYMLALEARELMKNTDRWALMPTARKDHLRQWNNVGDSYAVQVSLMLCEMRIKTQINRAKE